MRRARLPARWLHALAACAQRLAADAESTPAAAPGCWRRLEVGDVEPTGGGGYVLKADPSVKVGGRGRTRVWVPGCPAAACAQVQLARPQACQRHAGLPGSGSSAAPCLRPAQVTSRAHKMSKSRGNVINPDDVVWQVGAAMAAWLLGQKRCLPGVQAGRQAEGPGAGCAICLCTPPARSPHLTPAAHLYLASMQYGADSLRLYEMFMGPLRDTKVGGRACGRAGGRWAAS